MSPGGCRLAQGDPKAGPLEGEGIGSGRLAETGAVPTPPSESSAGLSA